MDRVIVARKLDSLLRCLARVAARCPQTIEALETNLDLQDVLVLNLTRAVQICVDLGTHLLVDETLAPPNTMGETFDRLAEAGVIPPALALRMKKAVGFRNIAVHAYDAVDWRIVFAIATSGMPKAIYSEAIVAVNTVPSALSVHDRDRPNSAVAMFIKAKHHASTESPVDNEYWTDSSRPDSMTCHK